MFLMIITAVILLDQATKYLAYVYLQPQNTIPIINKFFYLTYVENRGAAFGILQNQTWFLLIVPAIAIIAAFYYVYKNPNLGSLTKCTLGLIIGGAIGNLIDRVRLGFVIDFFDFRVFPVFNVADCAVVVGTAVLAFILLFDMEKVEA